MRLLIIAIASLVVFTKRVFRADSVVAS